MEIIENMFYKSPNYKEACKLRAWLDSIGRGVFAKLTVQHVCVLYQKLRFFYFARVEIVTS